MSIPKLLTLGMLPILSLAILPSFAAAQSGPQATPEIVAAAAAAKTPVVPGPFQPTWDSIREHYTVPQWFVDAKFGITMHWGLFSIAAYHNEWYEQPDFPLPQSAEIPTYDPSEQQPKAPYSGRTMTKQLQPPAGYAALLKESKERVRTAQNR